MSKKKIIAIASDHGGVELKADLMQRLEKNGHTVLNFGVDHSSDAVDYPDMAVPVAEKVLSQEADCGVLICGTGLGIGIAANKIKGIRAATVSDTFSAKMAKIHNNANILALGARVLGNELAWEVLSAYLECDFEGGRHETRVNKIMALEERS